jgi:hypothetical protein
MATTGATLNDSTLATNNSNANGLMGSNAGSRQGLQFNIGEPLSLGDGGAHATPKTFLEGDAATHSVAPYGTTAPVFDAGRTTLNAPVASTDAAAEDTRVLMFSGSTTVEVSETIVLAPPSGSTYRIKLQNCTVTSSLTGPLFQNTGQGKVQIEFVACTINAPTAYLFHESSSNYRCYFYSSSGTGLAGFFNTDASVVNGNEALTSMLWCGIESGTAKFETFRLKTSEDSRIASLNNTTLEINGTNSLARSAYGAVMVEGKVRLSDRDASSKTLTVSRPGAVPLVCCRGDDAGLEVHSLACSDSHAKDSVGSVRVEDRTNQLNCKLLADTGFACPVVWPGLDFSKYGGSPMLINDANHTALSLASFGYFERGWAFSGNTPGAAWIKHKDAAAGSYASGALAWSFQVVMAPIYTGATRVLYEVGGIDAAVFPSAQDDAVRKGYVAAFGPHSTEFEPDTDASGYADNVKARSVEWRAEQAGLVREMTVVFSAKDMYLGNYSTSIKVLVQTGGEGSWATQKTYTLPVHFEANVTQTIPDAALLSIKHDVPGGAESWDDIDTISYTTSGVSAGANGISITAGMIWLHEGASVNNSVIEVTSQLPLIADANVSFTAADSSAGQTYASTDADLAAEFNIHDIPDGTGSPVNPHVWTAVINKNTDAKHYIKRLAANTLSSVQYQYNRGLQMTWTRSGSTELVKRDIKYKVTSNDIPVDADQKHIFAHADTDFTGETTDIYGATNYAVSPQIDDAMSSAIVWRCKDTGDASTPTVPFVSFKFRVRNSSATAYGDITCHFDIETASLTARGWSVDNAWVTPNNAAHNTGPFTAMNAPVNGALAVLAGFGSRGPAIANGGALTTTSVSGTAVTRLTFTVPAGTALNTLYTLSCTFGPSESAGLQVRVGNLSTVDVAFRAYPVSSDDANSRDSAILFTPSGTGPGEAYNADMDAYVKDTMQFTPQDNLVLLRYNTGGNTGTVKYAISGDQTAATTVTASGTDNVTLPGTDAFGAAAALQSALAVNVADVDATTTVLLSAHIIGRKTQNYATYTEYLKAVSYIDNNDDNTLGSRYHIGDASNAYVAKASDSPAWAEVSHTVNGGSSQASASYQITETHATTDAHWVQFKWVFKGTTDSRQVTGLKLGILWQNDATGTALNSDKNEVKSFAGSTSAAAVSTVADTSAYLTHAVFPVTLTTTNEINIASQQSTVETLTDTALRPTMRMKLTRNPAYDVTFNLHVKHYDAAGTDINASIGSSSAVLSNADMVFSTTDYNDNTVADHNTTLDMSAMSATVKRIDVYAVAAASSSTYSNTGSDEFGYTGSGSPVVYGAHQRIATFNVAIAAEQNSAGADVQASRIYIARQFRITVTAGGFVVEQLINDVWVAGPTLNLAVSSEWQDAVGGVVSTSQVETVASHGASGSVTLSIVGYKTDQFAPSASSGAAPMYGTITHSSSLATPAAGTRLVGTSSDTNGRVATVVHFAGDSNTGVSRVGFHDIAQSTPSVFADMVYGSTFYHWRQPDMPSDYTWAKGAGAHASTNLTGAAEAVMAADLNAVSALSGSTPVTLRRIRAYATYNSATHWLPLRVKFTQGGYTQTHALPFIGTLEDLGETLGSRSAATCVHELRVPVDLPASSAEPLAVTLVGADDLRLLNAGNDADGTATIVAAADGSTPYCEISYALA